MGDFLSNYPQYTRGIQLFNEGEFYDAHEEWEEIWLKETGPAKPFLQGLIQLAAAFHHAHKKKIHEAQIALERALKKLGAYGSRHQGIALEKLVKDARDSMEGVSAGKLKVSFPKITYSV